MTNIVMSHDVDSYDGGIEFTRQQLVPNGDNPDNICDESSFHTWTWRNNGSNRMADTTKLHQKNITANNNNNNKRGFTTIYRRKVGSVVKRTYQKVSSRMRRTVKDRKQWAKQMLPCNSMESSPFMKRLVNFDTKYKVSSNVVTVACTSAIVNFGSGFLFAGIQCSIGAALAIAVSKTLLKKKERNSERRMEEAMRRARAANTRQPFM